MTQRVSSLVINVKVLRNTITTNAHMIVLISHPTLLHIVDTEEASILLLKNMTDYTKILHCSAPFPPPPLRQFLKNGLMASM